MPGSGSDIAPVQEITEIMKHIDTITINPAVDKSTQVQSVTSERKLRCDNPTYDAGGGGINEDQKQSGRR